MFLFVQKLFVANAFTQKECIMKKWIVNLAVALCLFGMTGLSAQAAEVVLYSSNQPELLDAVAQDFQKKTGVKLTVVRMGTGEAMKRIEAEKANPLADVFWSGDVSVLDNAKANFAPYDSPEAKTLPAGYKEKDNKWTAANTHLMIVMANTSLVPEAELPKSWKDLLDPKWKGKIVMANPQKSGSAYAQLYALNKILGWEGVQKLIENVKVLDSSSLIYKGTAAGEFPLGITMEYAAFRYIAGGDKNVKIIYPTDGVISAPEGAAIIANSKNPKEAKMLVDYLLSQDVVNKIYQDYYRRPARPDAAKVEGMPSVSDLTIFEDFDAAEANAMQKELLGKWRKEILAK